MRRVKRKIFAGSVCEQIVYSVSDGAKEIKSAKPRLRFKDESERAAHREAMARRNHTRLINANFSASDSHYSTLTFDGEHEVYYFPDAKRILRNYARRLRYSYPDAVIFLYSGRGKNTSRIHLHMISKGIPPEEISRLWGMGNIEKIEPLREKNIYNGIDHGQDFSGLANYLFDHWTPEQGGHRYFATRNARPYEKEEAREIVREYSEARPPRAPKGYRLVEARCTDYGYQYYKYVVKPPRKVWVVPRLVLYEEHGGT